MSLGCLERILNKKYIFFNGLYRSDVVYEQFNGPQQRVIKRLFTTGRTFGTVSTIITILSKGSRLVMVGGRGRTGFRKLRWTFTMTLWRQRRSSFKPHSIGSIGIKVSFRSRVELFTVRVITVIQVSTGTFRRVVTLGTRTQTFTRSKKGVRTGPRSLFQVTLFHWNCYTNLNEYTTDGHNADQGSSFRPDTRHETPYLLQGASVNTVLDTHGGSSDDGDCERCTTWISYSRCTVGCRTHPTAPWNFVVVGVLGGELTRVYDTLSPTT